MRIDTTIIGLAALGVAFAGGMALEHLRDGETFVAQEKQLQRALELVDEYTPKSRLDICENVQWVAPKLSGTNSGKAVVK